MERGLEQFFILALILFAALVDLLVRWLRGKTGNQGSPPSDVAEANEEPAVDEGLIEALEIEALDLERAKLRRATTPPVKRQVSQPQPVQARPQPAQREKTFLAVPGPRRPSEIRRWLKDPRNVRRGIVLMAVVGPCRGVQSE